MAGLLAMAGSASVGVGTSQDQDAAFDSASMLSEAGSIVASSKTSFSSWDRARLGACVALAGVSLRVQQSELDRRANCAGQLGLDLSQTQ